MNNWTAIGYIFLGFGLVFLLFGFFSGFMARAPYDIIATPSLVTLANTMMFAAMLPWVAVAALCFVVAVVGVVAGMKKQD